MGSNQLHRVTQFLPVNVVDLYVGANLEFGCKSDRLSTWVTRVTWLLSTRRGASDSTSSKNGRDPSISMTSSGV